MSKYKIFIFFSLQIFFLKVFSQQGEWTWMNGNNTPNSAGVFGIQGTPDPNNTPPAFYETCQWTDLQGNFWLFGGISNIGGIKEYSDLWKYNISTNEWTWVKGPGISEQPGVYGTQGNPSVNNNPGARSWGVAAWTDTAGNLWLFGGLGHDIAGTTGSLNDLWKYNISTNEWTWMKGSSIASQSGVYGTIGVSLPANCPGSRSETSCSWVVGDDLWFYGGTGIVTFPMSGYLCDLWKYNISSNEWTWMKGTNTLNQPAVYGTEGVPDPANNPGGRMVYSRWKDNSNNLWLFGGINNNGNSYNDLWKYDIITGNWTWMSGTNTVNDMGTYGTQCIPSVNNIPSARYEGRACWTDDCGGFWLFGGFIANNGYNDLWRYNPITNEWAWVSGSNLSNQTSIYGTEGVSAPANIPGNRCGSVSWKDINGNLWLFGGENYQWTEIYNSLWKYVPDPNCPINSVLQLTVSNDTSICKKDSVILIANGAANYEWNTGNTDDSITVSPQSTITYTVTGTNGLCSDTDEIIVTVNLLPTASAGADVSICSGEGTILIATGAGAGGTYLWNNNITTASITVNPVAVTTYAVTITNVNGCTDDTVVVVNVNLLPTIVINGSNTICEGADTTLKATGGASYLWNTGATIDSIIVTPVVMTTYTVTGIDNNNCANTDEIVITVNSLPEVDFGTDTCIGSGETIILDAGTGYTYSWQDNSTAQTYTVTEEGDYWIIATNNCGTDRDTIIITSCPSSVLYIPNSFTPNGDNRNDRFMPIYVNITEFEMYIFNRWGQEIFHTTDINEGWDGKYKGEICLQGVYTWLVFYKGVDDTEKQKKYGYVTLLK